MLKINSIKCKDKGKVIISYLSKKIQKNCILLQAAEVSEVHKYNNEVKGQVPEKSSTASSASSNSYTSIQVEVHALKCTLRFKCTSTSLRK